MPEVQNVGAVDYAQYQPSQYPQETYANNYNTMPEVYDESYMQMQQANKSRIGATILAGAIAVGLGVGGYLIGKRSGNGSEAVDKTVDAIKKELETVKNESELVKAELADLKNSEAVKNYDKLKETAEEVFKMAESKKVYFKGWINRAKTFRDTIKDKLRPFIGDTKKAADEVKDNVKKEAENATENTVEKAKDAAQELKEHATDTNK